MSSTKFVFFGSVGKKRKWPSWLAETFSSETWLLIGWDILIWNCWTEINNTWEEARSQHPLPSLCCSGGSEKQDGSSGLWLAETFSTSPLKPPNRFQRKLTGSKISTSSTKFVFFRPKMSSLASDWLRYFRLLFWNRWSEFNKTWQEARSQVCVFQANQKTKMAVLASDWLRHFRLLWNRWSEFNETS